MFSRLLQKYSSELAPAIPSNNLLGNKAAFERDPLQFLLDARDQYGDLVRMRFGPFWFHLLFDPQESYAVLVDKSNQYSKRTTAYQLIARGLGRGLLTNEGEPWRKQRRIAQPAFRKSAIRELSVRMSEAARDKVGEWRDQQQVGLLTEMTSLTLRIAGETLFDIDISKETSDIHRHVNDLQDLFRQMMTSPLMMLFPMVPSPSNIRFKECVENLDRIIFQIIEQRRHSPSSKTTLLKLFINARDDDGYMMSDTQLRDEVVTMLLAGYETLANTLTWTLHLISKHRDVSEGIHEELVGVLDGDTPNIDNIGGLSYLTQVLKEALRLYPPAWSMSRKAEKQDTILGKTISEGAVIVLSPYVIHRCSSIWSSPNTFNPDRFSPETGSPERGTYWPFLIGPRKCIGEHFAMTEALIVLATVLSKYELYPTNDRDIGCDPGVTLRPDSEIFVKLTKRT